MDLRLTVSVASGTRVDCVVSCDGGVRVDAVASALLAAVASPEHAPEQPVSLPPTDAARTAALLSCRRLGGVLPANLAVGRCGLLDGDVVAVAWRGIDERIAVVGDEERYLVVREGPDRGRWLALPSGRHVLGRGRGASLLLTDPGVSREMAEIHVDDEVEIVGLTGSNALTVDGRVVEHPLALGPGSVVNVGDTVLVVVAPSATGPGTVAMRRPPRQFAPRATAAVSLPEPPGTRRKSRFPVYSLVGTVLAGVALALVFANLRLLVFMILAPVTLVASYVESRRDSRSEHRDDEVAWRAQLGDIARRLDIAQESERQVRVLESPPATELYERVRTRATSVWERSAGDADLLVTRIGTGQDDSRSVIEGDARHPELAAITDRFARIDDVPVVVDLDVDRVVGVASESLAAGLVPAVVLQLASLASPDDLYVLALVPAAKAEGWQWLEWLPHAMAGAASVRSDRAVLDDEAASLRALQELTSLDGDWAERGAPRVLVIVDDGGEVSRPALTRLLQGVASSGVRVLWTAPDPVRLPSQCTATLAPGSPGRVRLGRERGSTDAAVETIDAETTERWARALAPLRDLSAGGDGASSLPRLITLPNAFGDLTLVTDVDAVRARWTVGRPMSAVVGAGVDGPFAIDLRADGPHALVAGTTGSGKSELLQTWIAAMAASLSPARLQFVLVDYKGGAAFRECSELPHTAGFITDLTPHLARRALTALNAELRRREGILNDHRAKDQVDLETRNPEAAPPNLVLVIDEFAALASEIPQFVDGVIDVAQRGRSLGIHLVLATQRPAGVVSGAIRANTNLRIALRTAPGESDDVIGTGEADHIDVPGRAFVRVGSRAPVPVQVAYAGGTTMPDDAGAVRVRAMRGRLTAASRPAGVAAEVVAGDVVSADVVSADVATADVARAAPAASDLLRLVHTIDAAWMAEQRPTPVSPILPALPIVLSVDALGSAVDAARCLVPFGLTDVPAEHRQTVAAVDLDTDGGLVVFGAAGAGKTTALRTLVASLTRRDEAMPLVVYGIDAARGLHALSALPPVGEIVALDDHERVLRVFALARAAIDDRAGRFAATGASSLSEYARLAPGSVPERLVIVIDGLPAFLATYAVRAFGYLGDELGRLANDGRAVGVHVLATADRYASLPSELRSAFRRRLVLRQSSVDDYSAFGLRVGDDEIDLPPGRGYLDADEVQVAVVGGSPDGAHQLQALDALTAERVAGGGAARRRAPRVPVLPDVVDAAELPPPTRVLEPVVGLVDELTSTAYRLDLWDDHLLVAGPARSGRSTTIMTIANQLVHTAADIGPAPHVVVGSPTGRGLVGLDPRVELLVGADALADRLEQLSGALADDTASSPLVVLVDDWHELHEVVTPPLDALLAVLVAAGKDGPVRVVVAVDNHVARRPYSSVLDTLRRGRHGLQLQPTSDDEITFDVVAPPAARRFPVGRALAVRREGAPAVVQIASSPARG